MGGLRASVCLSDVAGRLMARAGRRWLALISGSVLAAALASTGFAACPIQNARYRMLHDPDVWAGFHTVGRHEGWISDLAFFVHSKSSSQTHWFLFDQGTARYIALISTTNVLESGWAPPDADGGVRPLGDTDIMLADKAYRFASEAPRTGDARPEFILLPDLSDILWSKGKPREDVPTDLFKFDHCAAAGEAE